MKSNELKSTEEYCRLKKLRLEATDNFEYINLLTLRLLIFVNSTDSNIYDFEDVLSNIRLTVDDLYKYCLDYREMLRKYSWT